MGPFGQQPGYARYRYPSRGQGLRLGPQPMDGGVRVHLVQVDTPCYEPGHEHWCPDRRELHLGEGKGGRRPRCPVHGRELTEEVALREIDHVVVVGHNDPDAARPYEEHVGAVVALREDQ